MIELFRGLSKNVQTAILYTYITKNNSLVDEVDFIDTYSFTHVPMSIINGIDEHYLFNLSYLKTNAIAGSTVSIQSKSTQEFQLFEAHFVEIFKNDEIKCIVNEFTKQAVMQTFKHNADNGNLYKLNALLSPTECALVPSFLDDKFERSNNELRQIFEFVRGSSLHELVMNYEALGNSNILTVLAPGTGTSQNMYVVHLLKRIKNQHHGVVYVRRDLRSGNLNFFVSDPYHEGTYKVLSRTEMNTFMGEKLYEEFDSFLENFGRWNNSMLPTKHFKDKEYAVVDVDKLVEYAHYLKYIEVRGTTND